MLTTQSQVFECLGSALRIVYLCRYAIGSEKVLLGFVDMWICIFVFNMDCVHVLLDAFFLVCSATYQPNFKGYALRCPKVPL